MRVSPFLGGYLGGLLSFAVTEGPLWFFKKKERERDGVMTSLVRVPGAVPTTDPCASVCVCEFREKKAAD